jgi:serine/threonine-protein kinase
VYEAIDPGINRRVAVKELALTPNLSGRQRRERIERFYREAKAAGNLKHPHIVTVFEVGQEGDRHYIAMEYLEGPTLRDILRMRNNLSIKEALTVTLQLADALGYAHGQGVIHRDVKPDNIHLVLPNDTVKLTDFGIARILADPAITSTGQVFGTPSYMSPEQIMSKEVDHRTDIFSLGVVLYEMIVGKKPFIGDSVITITYHIMNTVPTIPASLPSGVYNIINRALTKDPALRYQNMAALAADIQAELSFADSPYRVLPPAGVRHDEYSDERTEAVDKKDLSRSVSSVQFVPPTGSFAPPTGIAQAITGSGGPVAPAASVLPMPASVPAPPPAEYSPRSTFPIAVTIIGVLVLLMVLGFALSKAFTTNQKTNQALAAYNRANTERSRGDNMDAERDYQEALDDATPGSPLYENAKLALSESPTSSNGSTGSVPNSVLKGTILDPGADLSSSSTGGGSASATGTVPAASAAAGTGSAAADADLSQAKNYLAQGDQADAISQFEAASTADPTGSSGKAAGTQLAQIFSQAADTAIQGGQKQTALDDWQAVVKYAPDDPLATQASQKILQYSGSGAPSTSPSTGSVDQPISTGT